MRRVTERPILFSGDMVRAILAGRKRMTRRIVKGIVQRPDSLGDSRMMDCVKDWYGCYSRLDMMTTGTEGCPYGDVGGLLWVREMWQHEDTSCDDHRCANPDHIYYRATDPAPDTFSLWRPSIYLPKWAARIWLEITSIRAEKLQQISLEDIEREGIVASNETAIWAAWIDLWDGKNSKRGFGWLTDPWVWVISFRRVER